MRADVTMTEVLRIGRISFRRISLRMIAFPPDRKMHCGPLRSAPRAIGAWLGIALSCLATAPAARAQISLATAVDLALKNNPRVLGAQDDVRRARAQLAESHDAYVPSATFGSNVGQAYGYLPYPPTLFTGNGGSLVYSASQHDYILSARAGLRASQMTLKDAGETVAQDTALGFLALDHDQQRAKAIHQQLDDADKLVVISQQRLDAGQDTRMDLTQAKMTQADLRVSALHADDDLETDRQHLARLIGVPSASLAIDGDFPDAPIPQQAPPTGPYANATIAAAFFSAEAKQHQATGDSKVRFWPQINLVVNYTRYATFTDSFKNLEHIYQGNNGQMLLTANEAAFGIQVNLPFFDKSRSDKARETTAEAAHAMHDAQNAEIDAQDAQTRLRHSIAELQAQEDAATLHQEYAQEQLDVLRQQLQSGTGNPDGQPMTPKDEQNALIAEREKYLAVLDAGFQLHQSEVQFLRQTGQLINWIGAHDTASSAASKPSLLPMAPAPAK